jgi:hypothetical protein
MGGSAVLTIFLYSFSFDLMSYLVQALNKTDRRIKTRMYQSFQQSNKTTNNLN